MPGPRCSYDAGAARVTADYRIEAHRIHGDLPVVDGHNDLPWELWARAGGDLTAADPSGPLEGYHTDLPRFLDACQPQAQAGKHETHDHWQDFIRQPAVHSSGHERHTLQRCQP